MLVIGMLFNSKFAYCKSRKLRLALGVMAVSIGVVATTKYKLPQKLYTRLVGKEDDNDNETK